MVVVGVGLGLGAVHPQDLFVCFALSSLSFNRFDTSLIVEVPLLAVCVLSKMSLSQMSLSEGIRYQNGRPCTRASMIQVFESW